MFFMTDTKRRIVVGWSAKCGCTHIKRIWLYLTTGKDMTERVHDQIVPKPLPPDIHRYTVLIVARNPYERLVSGFLDKYGRPGKIRNMWPKHVPLTFSNLVIALTRNDWNVVEKHHFAPQTQEAFDLSRLRRAKRLVVCDLGSIDYSILEKAFNKTIPNEMIEWHGRHARKPGDQVQDRRAALRTVDDLDRATLCISDLYPVQLREAATRVFANDLRFFAEHGLRYRPPQSEPAATSSSGSSSS